MRMIYKPNRNKQYFSMGKQGKQQKQAVRTPNRDDEEGVISSLDNCYNLDYDVLESVISQEITLNHRKNTGNHSPVSKHFLISAGLLFLLGVSLTFTDAKLNIQFTFYLLSLAVMVGTDPLDLFSQILARESRLLFSFVIFLSCVGLHFFLEDARFWYVTAAVGLIVAILIRFLNYRWMRTENYLMDDSVEGAIVNNPESLAYQAYIFYGKVKCRTLALRQNLQFTEKVLDGCLGLFYRLGWADGYRKTEQAQATIQKLTERAQKAEKEAKEAKAEAKAAKERYESAAAERDSFHSQLTGAKATSDYHVKLYESISAENIRLNNEIEELERNLEEMAANKEPVVNLSKVAAVKQEIKESGEDRARELLRQGYSIRKTVELSGVSFYNVNRIRTEMMENGELQQADRKVVNM